MFVNGKNVKGKGVPVHAMKPCRSSRSIAQFVYNNSKICVYEGTAVRLKEAISATLLFTVLVSSLLLSRNEASSILN